MPPQIGHSARAGPVSDLALWLEAGCFLRSACGVAWLVGVRARSGEPPALHDQVLLADRPVLKPAFEDLASPRGLTCLRRQRRAGDVRGHAVMRHRTPWVIPGRRLGEPDIGGGAGPLPSFQLPRGRIPGAELD